MISLDAFSDELQKIAANRREALYSPGAVAHEAGHAIVHKNRGVTAARMILPAAASGYARARMGHAALKGGGMGPAEFGAVSAAANVPVLADEAASTAIAIKALKNDKKMSKKDWKRTALQLAAVNSSYLANPLVDVGILGASKAGLHPLAQIALKTAVSPALGKAWGALGMMVKGPKVDARRAKEIVQKTAPGTPVFATKTPIPSGSLYVPPAKKNKIMGALIDAQLGANMSKRDLSTIKHKGGVLIAPLDAKRKAKGILNPFDGMSDKTKFRRIT